MDKLLVILRNQPYGKVNAAEAVRHAGGAGGFDYEAILYLIDSGVCAARRGQNAGDSGFLGLGESIEMLSDDMAVYADRKSLEACGLKESDLIDGVKIDDGEVLKKAIRDAQSIMIY